MSLSAKQKPSFFKVLRLTGRDLRVLGCSALLFASLAVGAVSLAQPAHSQIAAAICSPGKYFR